MYVFANFTEGDRPHWVTKVFSTDNIYIKCKDLIKNHKNLYKPTLESQNIFL